MMLRGRTTARQLRTRCRSYLRHLNVEGKTWPMIRTIQNETAHLRATSSKKPRATTSVMLFPKMKRPQADGTARPPELPSGEGLPGETRFYLGYALDRLNARSPILWLISRRLWKTSSISKGPMIPTIQSIGLSRRRPSRRFCMAWLLCPPPGPPVRTQRERSKFPKSSA